MGSPLSGVLACVYLEFLESGPFKYIILNTAHYFRYIDDMLLICPQDLDFHSITDRLNNVEPSIKFTYELENNSTSPFLDILFIKNINKLEFKVYRKNGHIHFYSRHNNTKRCNIFSDAGVYCIPCKNCKLKYIGETSRNFHVCLKEHKRDIRIGNFNNVLFQHIVQSNHSFDFSFAKMPMFIHNKRQRRIFEAVAISLYNSLNTRPGFYNISPYLRKSILNSYNIFHR